MATINMVFFSVNLLKQQFLHVIYLTEFVHFWKTIHSLGKSFGVFSKIVLQICKGVGLDFNVWYLNKSPIIIRTHYMIRWEILAKKMLPQELLEVIKSIISSVSFDKLTTLDSRLFSQMCNGCVCQAKLYYLTMKWHSFWEVTDLVFFCFII